MQCSRYFYKQNKFNRFSYNRLINWFRDDAAFPNFHTKLSIMYILMEFLTFKKL